MVYTSGDKDLVDLINFRDFLKLFYLLLVLVSFCSGWNVSVSKTGINQ